MMPLMGLCFQLFVNLTGGPNAYLLGKMRRPKSVFLCFILSELFVVLSGNDAFFTMDNNKKNFQLPWIGQVKKQLVYMKSSRLTPEYGHGPRFSANGTPQMSI